MKAAIHTVTPDNIATFLGHKLHASRTVEHHDGFKTQQLASMKKNIYSLNPLRE